MKNKLYKFSLLLNAVFILVFLFIAYWKKEKILETINPQRYSIIMVGHSLTGGCQWDKELNRSDIKNTAKGGASTYNFRQFVFEEVVIRRPKICFIDGGMNDIVYGIPNSRIYANYEMMVDTLLKYNIIPVLQSTLYCYRPNDSITNNYVDSVNIFLSDLALKKKIHYINHNRYLSKDGRLDPKYTIDGYHINDAANKIWAREVQKVLNEEKI
jgi:lysophospholipase L1-like esterase